MPGGCQARLDEDHHADGELELHALRGATQFAGETINRVLFFGYLGADLNPGGSLLGESTLGLRLGWSKNGTLLVSHKEHETVHHSKC